MSEPFEVNTNEAPLLILKELEGNSPTQLYGLQSYLEPYATELMIFWWFIFLLTVLGVLYAGFKAQKHT